MKKQTSNKEKIKSEKGKWRVHTPNLLKEIMEVSQPKATDILRTPLNIFKNLLVEVGKRASEINDPKLNALMCRLTIYAIADPQDKDYNKKLVEEIINKKARRSLNIPIE